MAGRIWDVRSSFLEIEGNGSEVLPWESLLTDLSEISVGLIRQNFRDSHTAIKINRNRINKLHIDSLIENCKPLQSTDETDNPNANSLTYSTDLEPKDCLVINDSQINKQHLQTAIFSLQTDDACLLDRLRDRHERTLSNNSTTSNGDKCYGAISSDSGVVSDVACANRRANDDQHKDDTASTILQSIDILPNENCFSASDVNHDMSVTKISEGPASPPNFSTVQPISIGRGISIKHGQTTSSFATPSDVTRSHVPSSGVAPNGVTSSGMTPSGKTPSYMTSYGIAPSDVTPLYMTSSDVTLIGVTPSGVTPSGVTSSDMISSRIGRGKALEQVLSPLKKSPVSGS